MIEYLFFRQILMYFYLFPESIMALFTWIQGVMGGLLISSCCLIQLFLNLFGIGCAGLNTLLLPYRPFFVSLTIVSLTYAFYRSRPSKWHFTAVVTITVLLSLSPELLRFYNDSHSSIAIKDQDLHQTRWKIDGMHCEACRSAVIRALRSIEGVDRVDVSLQTNEAILVTRHEIDSNQVKEKVQSAGFHAEPI